MNCMECGGELAKKMPVTSNEKGIVHLHCVNGVPESHDELLRKLLAFVELKQEAINNSSESIDFQIGYEQCLDELSKVLQLTEFIEVS